MGTLMEAESVWIGLGQNRFDVALPVPSEGSCQKNVQEPMHGRLRGIRLIGNRAQRPNRMMQPGCYLEWKSPLRAGHNKCRDI
jgi:hypothetical protein